MSSQHEVRVENVAQDARHTTGEWLTWALKAVEDPRAEFELVIRDMVTRKMHSTRRGADELMHDTTGDLKRSDRSAGGHAA